ncbi:MAG: hypothetical protein R3B70_21910 [Polyangiaceae bacterium]
MPTNWPSTTRNCWSARARSGASEPKKATVTQALLEYIQRREQAAVVDLLAVDFDPTYDYKGTVGVDESPR